MVRARLGLLILAMAAASSAMARTVVPIHARTLSDGVRRYSVPLTIDGQVIETALDTGATGLRLLPGDAPSPAGGRRARYVFLGGVELDGTQGPADLALGDLQGRVDIQRVSKVGCTAVRPRCAGSLGLPAFSFESDSLPGQGFRAILGLNLAADPKDHPLRRLGAHRWIVSLPRGDEDGELIIDPTDAEVADFVLLPLKSSLAWRKDGAHDAIEGCLQQDGGRRRTCGPVLMDTGAAGAAVINAADVEGLWADVGKLTFEGATLPPVEIPKVAAGRGWNLPKPMILAGAAPYLTFDVLYDPERRMIGLKPRPAPTR